MKKKKYSLRFVFIVTLALFVTQFNLLIHGQSLEDRILEKLNLTEGMIVADLGAGNGTFSVKMAGIVGPEGHVYANEISERRLGEIESRIEDQGIDNVTTVHGEEEDAVLPVKVDFMVMKYVYHHLEKPGSFMAKLLKYLNPGGRLAVIAVDINHVSQERANKERRDACISDPEETRKAIEKSGFEYEKREDVKSTRDVEYILFFKASEYSVAYCSQPRSNGIHEIYSIRLDGTDNQKVIESSIGLNHHDISPDGKKYAAVGYVGPEFSTWSIHVFDSDGKGLVRLTHEEGLWDSEPSWSPDGKKIVFTRTYPQENHREELWLMNADGSEQHFIGIEGFAAKWSPDGTRFIYSSKRPEKYEIYSCAVDVTDEIRLTETEANESYPMYSPDGSQIVFCASTGTYNTPENIKTFEIFVMKSDGTDMRQITDNDSCDLLARWSPDGSRLLFSSDRHQAFKWEVYVMNADGTDARRITYSPEGITAINPVWKIN